MNVSCTVRLAFASEDHARKVLQAIQIDDEGFVSSTVEHSTVVATLTAASVASLLHTLDDYLACASLAESVVTGASNAPDRPLA